jgi:DNA-binding NarL/FixJ family response regulator
VRQLRVLIVGAARLIHDIVSSAVMSQPDMSLLPDLATVDGELLPAQRTDADVVVCLLDDTSGQGATMHVQQTFPHRAVLALHRGGEHAWLYDYGLRMIEEFQGDLSPDVVLDAIRRGARGRSG